MSRHKEVFLKELTLKLTRRMNRNRVKSNDISYKYITQNVLELIDSVNSA